jgi:hypothetical protein
MGNCYYNDDVEGDEEEMLNGSGDIRKRRDSFKNAELNSLKKHRAFKEDTTLKFGIQTIKVDTRYYKFFKDLKGGEIEIEGFDILVVEFINDYIMGYYENETYVINDEEFGVETVINAIKFIDMYNVDLLHPEDELIQGTPRNELEYLLFEYLISTIDTTLDTIMYLESNPDKKIILHPIIVDIITPLYENEGLSEENYYNIPTIERKERLSIKIRSMAEKYIVDEFFKQTITNEYPRTEKYRFIIPNELDDDDEDPIEDQELISAIEFQNNVIISVRAFDETKFKILYPPFKDRLYRHVLHLRTIFNLRLMFTDMIEFSDFTRITKLQQEYSKPQNFIVMPKVTELIYIINDLEDLSRLYIPQLNENITGVVIDTKKSITSRRLAYLFASNLDPPTWFSQITKLTCSSINLNNLDGIVRYLPNLTYLDCSNNKQLILKEVPANLKTLNASDIKSLDLSSNKTIEYLYINNTTPTTLGKELKLKEFECRICMLSSLTLNEGLEKLDCSHNNLSTLECPDSLINLVCNNNNRDINIDLSSNLKELNLYETQATYVLEKCPDLEIFVCSAGNITELNLSVNLSLKELYCRRNKIGTLDLKHLIYLETLDCSTCNLTELKIPDSLKVLECTDNYLKRLDCPKSLESLTVVDNNDGFKQIRLCLDLSKCTNLKTLVCEYSPLSNFKIDKCKALETLIINDSKVSGKYDLTSYLNLKRISYHHNENLDTDQEEEEEEEPLIIKVNATVEYYIDPGFSDN